MSNSCLLCEYNLIRKIYADTEELNCLLNHEIVSTLEGKPTRVSNVERKAVQTLLYRMGVANAERAKQHLLDRYVVRKNQAHPQKLTHDMLAFDIQCALMHRFGVGFEFPKCPQPRLLSAAAYLCKLTSTDSFDLPSIGRIEIYMTSFRGRLPNDQIVVDEDGFNPMIRDNPLELINHMLELNDDNDLMSHFLAPVDEGT